MLNKFAIYNKFIICCNEFVCVCMYVCFHFHCGGSEGRLVQQVKPTNQVRHFSSQIDSLLEKVQNTV